MVLQMWQICSTFLKLYVAWFAATPQGKTDIKKRQNGWQEEWS